MTSYFNRVSYDMTSPNQEFIFFEGEFTLKNMYVDFVVVGRIYVCWLPRHGVRFDGLINIESGTTDLLSLAIDTPQIIVNENSLGHVSLGDVKDHKIFGKVYNLRPIGDLNLPVEKILFGIPNMKKIENTIVIGKDGAQTNHIQTSQLVLEDETFSIKLSPAQNFQNLEENLKVEGGYIITHQGEITSHGEVLTFETKQEIFECLNYFLNFLTGVRTYAIMIQRVVKDIPIWVDYRLSKNNPHQDVISWSPSWSEHLNDLWINFRRFWANHNDKDVLKNIIYWYVEANMNNAQLEGSIVMAQAALEALYNWINIERNSTLDRTKIDELDGKSAQFKIKALLNHIGCSTRIPASFKSLSTSGPEFKRGNNAIPEIRNALVHGSKSKRIRLKSIDIKAKIEVSRLSLWYIELILLHELEYKGEYHNRCSENHLFRNELEVLPFNKRH